jgi:hypothetical protein
MLKTTTEGIFVDSKIGRVSSVVGAPPGRHSRLDPHFLRFNTYERELTQNLHSLADSFRPRSTILDPRKIFQAFPHCALSVNYRLTLFCPFQDISGNHIPYQADLHPFVSRPAGFRGVWTPDSCSPHRITPPTIVTPNTWYPCR